MRKLKSLPQVQFKEMFEVLILFLIKTNFSSIDFSVSPSTENMLHVIRYSMQIGSRTYYYKMFKQIHFITK